MKERPIINIHDHVIEQLLYLEDRYNIRILYAAEAGKRAGGYGSTRSAWDVRFIYARPLSWYLALGPHSDVINLMLPGKLDLNGWDLQNALYLVAGSNPPLMKWLFSPIVYYEQPPLVRRLRELQARYHSPRASMYHYLHSATRNFREYLQEDEVGLKNYFPVLLPVLACRWIESIGTRPPVELTELMERKLPDTLSPLVDDLLARKQANEKLGSGPQIPELHTFLESEIERLGRVVQHIDKVNVPGFGLLDELFLASLKSAWQQNITL